MLRVRFTVHRALEALRMGNHVSGNLITIPSEAQRNKWGKGKDKPDKIRHNINSKCKAKPTQEMR